MKRFAAGFLLSLSATATAAPPPAPAPSPLDPPSAAAPAPSPLAPPGAALPAPSPLSPPSGAPPPPQAPDDSGAQNLIAELVVGGAFGIAGLYGGGYLGYAAECASGCPGDFGGLGGLLVGSALGLTIATTTGVVLMGGDRDHDSSVALTWLGTVVGGTVGVMAAGKMVNDSVAGASIVLATSTALGGALMFHATRTRHRPKAAFRMVPFTSGSGFGLSLVGSTP